MQNKNKSPEIYRLDQYYNPDQYNIFLTVDPLKLEYQLEMTIDISADNTKKIFNKDFLVINPMMSSNPKNDFTRFKYKNHIFDCLSW